MGFIKTKSQRVKQTVLCFVGVALVIIGFVILRPSPEIEAAIDPGLDSGNAVVDRTSVPGQTILKYQTTGTSTFKAPAGVTNVRVLVDGGGGGAGIFGGGGGAGGVIANPNVAVTPGVSNTITVGSGGTGAASRAVRGGNGGNSVFGALTAVGGGGGGSDNSDSYVPSISNGANGGSGGGAGDKTPSVGGTGTGGQGNNGGNATAITHGAGGGGAGGAGQPGSTTVNLTDGGDGGLSINNDITGPSVAYAGGGGGQYGGTGGGAGAGNGAGANFAPGTDAAPNTGSGGGGGANAKGGNGGSGVVIVRFATQDITPPSPGGVSGLTMWYKADSAGNTNALWNDSSGLGYNITQATGSKQPVLTTNAINFNPAYVFDGTDDVFRMDGQGIGSSEPMTAFYGANLTRTDGGYRYFNEFGDDSPSITLNNGKPNLYARTTTPIALEFSTAETGVPHVYGFISPNANNQSRIVGVDDNEQSQNVTTGTYTTSSPNGQAGNTFGGTNGSGGTSWAGPIAEAMYFNRVLTPAERLKVVSYLGIKYGVTRYQGASGNGYADSSGATIWSADSTFKNNIAGIGRDDTSVLNQKQSKSTGPGTDILTIGNGTIAATNQANANNFTSDRSFLLWGHNNAATNTNTAVTGTSYVRMNRIWKAIRTNTVGQVKVQIPTSAVTGGNNGVLFVSNSTTFDGSSQRVNMTVNGANYEADVTLPAGTSYFSFGSLTGSDIQFVSKTATDIGGDPITSYTPGESMEYVLEVKNNGPDNAGVVTVTDTLPAGVVPVSATGGGWNCNIASQTVTCTRSALNSGVTAPGLIIEVDIASSVTGSKANTATASVANDPDNTNNSASLTLPAAPKADLSIAKSHTGTPVAGNPHTYKFTVTNNGPSDVASFTVTDPLNSKMSLVSSTNGVVCAPVGLPDGQTITCTGGALTANGPGSTVAFDMVVNVAGDYGGGIISNTGTVAVPAGTIDPTPGNNSSTDESNVLVDTQLGIVKNHTGNFTAGVNNDFTITVDNQGPSTSPTGSVTITDTLDEDFAYVSAVGTGWSCNPNNGTVTCTNTAPILPGATAPDITLTVLVDSIAKASTSNIAEVSSTTPDSDLSDNSSANLVTIDSEADLGITKTHVAPTFTAGQQEQYTFSVVNNGPSADAPSYTISDTLPAGVTFVSATGAAASCTGTTTITCTGGGIGAGDPAQVTTITVTVDGGATGTLSNTATIAPAPGTTDPTPANDSSTDMVNVEPNADLSITKSHAGNLTAGDDETYTITVHNAGPSNVSSFTVTDTLDDNLAFQTTVGCSAINQVVTCTGGALTSGNDAVITLNVTVDSTATPGSSIQNTAAVTPPAGVNDPDSSNNSDTATDTVDASADLSVTKTHTGNFTAGSNNNFTIDVTNNGPSDASTFTLTDVLPTGLTYVSAVGTGVGCNNVSQTVTCTYGPTIIPGQTVTITLTVEVDGNTVGGTTKDNTADVSSATPDPTPGNDSDTDTVTIDSEADLAIVKTNDTDFTAGNDEDYNILVTNNGPSNASAFTVTDTLPAGLTFVESVPNGLCSAVLQVVTCNGGTLASGAQTNFKIRVHTDAGLSSGAVINNTADVATIAPTTDPTPGNDSSTDPTTIVDVTDLSIQKGHTGTFVAGQTGQYTFTVNNAGPSAAPASDVQVSDTLPEGMTFASETGTGWDCTGSTGRNVTCTYAPSLAVSGTTPTLTVTVNIAPDKQGEVTNTGTVISTLDDSDPPDDSDSDTTTIVAQADLTAAKNPQGAGPFVAGQSITYRFEVTNNGGPSQASNVTITDNLQGDFTYQSFAGVSGGTWDCSESGGTVTCTLPSLAIGATAIVDVTLKIAEDAPNPLVNSASTTFDGTVENPGDANPSISTPLSYSADLEVDITHEQKTYHGGDSVEFDFTIINHGPSAAEDVVMTATIPDGLTITGVNADTPAGGSILSGLNRFFFPRVSAASNPFSCSLQGNKLICTTSKLFVGVYHLFVTGKIANNFTGNMVLSAHITSSTPDPNPNDTSATDTITGILAASDLANTGQSLLLAGAVATGLLVLLFRLWRKKATDPTS